MPKHDEQRRQRLAEELRANLRKRKGQAKDRAGRSEEEAPGNEPQPAGEASPPQSPRS